MNAENTTRICFYISLMCLIAIAIAVAMSMILRMMRRHIYKNDFAFSHHHPKFGAIAGSPDSKPDDTEQKEVAKKAQSFSYAVERFERWVHYHPLEKISCADAQSLLLQAVTAIDIHIREFENDKKAIALRKKYMDLINSDQKVSSWYDPPW
jgi:hypothetical protein